MGGHDRAMAPNQDRVTIYHNPNCSTSKHALATLDELAVDHDVVQYLKQPPDRATLTWIVEHLEDPVADLVRKDNYFAEQGLKAEDYVEPDAVIDLRLSGNLVHEVCHGRSRDLDGPPPP